MKSTLLLLALFLTSGVLAKQSLTLSSKHSSKGCFPVNHFGPHAHLDVTVTSYTPSDVLGDYTVRKDTHVNLLFYRKNQVNESYNFRGDYGPLKVCTPEALTRGYCVEEDHGKLLVKYRDGATQNVSNIFIDDMEKHEEIFKTSEVGYYCVSANAAWASDFEVEVHLNDGYRMDIFTRQHLWIAISNFSCDLLLLLALVLPWWGWSKRTTLSWPFVIQWLVSKEIFALLIILLGMMRFSLDANSWAAAITELVQESIDVWTRMFMMYQYSAGFTYDRIEDFEGIKMFGVYYLLVLLGPLIRHITVISDEPSISAGIFFMTAQASISTIYKLTIYYMMFSRYTKTLKEYKDFNRQRSPILHQFQALFRVIYGVQTVFPFVFTVLFMGLQSVLEKWSLYSDTFLIDGVAVYGDTSRFLIIGSVVTLSTLYVNWTYWRPECYEEGRDYKERGE